MPPLLAALALPASAATVELAQPQPISDYGSAVAGVGDVDGDGFDDVVVTDVLVDSAYLYRGGPLGIDPVAATVLTGTGWFGASVVGADVNADGFSDVVVGATLDSTGPNRAGSVSVFLGSAFGLANVPAGVAYGPQDELLGSDLAVADFDGDGHDDVLAANGTFPRRAWLFAGDAAGGLTHVWTSPNLSTTGFGIAVAAGDVDGDGWPEAVIGDDASGPAGRVFVFAGSAAWPAPAATTVIPGVQGNPAISASFGYDVAYLGDVDLDGYGDLGIVGENANGFAAHVYAGGAAGLVEIATIGGRVVSHVAAAGDVDADGWPDLLVGSRLWNTLAGSLAVHLGGPAGFGPGSRALAGESNGMGSGDLVGSIAYAAGDVDGDGFGDVVVSSTEREVAWVIGGHEEMAATAGRAAPGALLDVEVTGALPGEEVAILMGPGTAAGTSCPLALGGLCHQVRRPNRAGSAIADATGYAAIQVPIPGGAPVGATLSVQPVVVSDHGWRVVEIGAPVAVVLGP